MNAKKTILKSQKLIIKPEDTNNPWEGKWIVFLKDSSLTPIGWVSFAGEKHSGTIPISIELQELYRNRGYGTEVLKMMVDWAFLHKNVIEISAEADPDNDKFIHALEKAGFVIRTYSKIAETYSVIKPKSVWTGVYIMIGIVLGLLLGIVFGNVYVGFAVGIISCFLMGAIMDSNSRKEREDITGEKGK